MNKLTIKAYAKLNLYLDITGRRSDGYHELKTVMQSADLYDLLTFELAPGTGIELTTDRSDLPVNADNLVCKGILAALSFGGAGHSGLDCKIKVRLEKHIPSQAGMGGGSADCAAAIIAMNQLFHLGLDESELMQVGKMCGADVPFCIKGGTALCEGIGDRLTPLTLPEGIWFAVSKPTDAVSTPEAYKLFDLCGKPGAGSYDGFESALSSGDISGLGGQLYNAFTAVCAPESVRNEIERLRSAGALGAEMTGSGSAVFGIFDSKDAAEGAAGASPLPFSGTFRPIGSGTEIVR